MKKITNLGGSGFIGRNLVLYFSKNIILLQHILKINLKKNYSK